MSIVLEHIKANKILKDVLDKKITSYEEVKKQMGEGEYYALWAKNIWEEHTTESPSIDLKERFPSKNKIKEYKFYSNGEYFISNGKTFEEAKEKVFKITGKDVEETTTVFKVKWNKVK